MKNNGFILVEVLIVSIFVSGVLIFLFIQFSSLSKSYSESFKYNTVEDLYTLDNIKKYIERDTSFITYLDNNISNMKYIDITDCSLLTNSSYCSELFTISNIDKIFITLNEVPKSNITSYEEEFTTFINKINKEGDQKYRIVASFKNFTYSTLRFGE